MRITVWRQQHQPSRQRYRTIEGITRVEHYDGPPRIEVFGKVCPSDPEVLFAQFGPGDCWAVEVEHSGSDLGKQAKIEALAAELLTELLTLAPAPRGVNPTEL